MAKINCESSERGCDEGGRHMPRIDPDRVFSSLRFGWDSWRRKRRAFWRLVTRRTPPGLSGHFV